MYNTIQGGGFGTTGPINGFSPYMNPPMPPQGNMINFGGSYQTPYQQQQFVFQPTPVGYQQPYGNQQYIQHNDNYYNPYAGTSYGNRANYFNPYGQFDYNYGYSQYPNQPIYGYQQQYPGYQPYGYQPYGQTMSLQQTAMQQHIELEKIKLRGVNRYLGREMSEEELDRRVNPMSGMNKLSKEEQKSRQEFNFMTQLHEQAMQPYQPPTTSQLVDMNILQQASKFREQYDSHSMFEFLNNDFNELCWRMWFEKNTIPNNGRNMSGTYKSKEYNELLAMHRSSNPYINQLMDDSRYDNNTDDYEIGMQAAIERERRRQSILGGGVPDFISSPEVQAARHEWTQKLMSQIYEKEAKKANVQGNNS